MKAIIILWIVIAGNFSFAVAGTAYFFALDTPAELNGSDYWSHQILQNNHGVYSSVIDLSGGLQIGGLHRQAINGTWLFSPSFPVEINGVEYEARDIVAYDGSVYWIYLKGSTIGLPEDVRIDSLYLDDNNGLYFSIDIPAMLDGIEYSGADLIYFNGSGCSLFWDAETFGVPSDANVVGAALDGSGQIVLSFDIPVDLANTTFMPGELVQWNGSSFASYSKDSAWPLHAHVSDFAFPPISGGISPSGAVPLTVTKALGGQITLTWSPSCSSSDVDYEVYAGTIGDYYSHVSFLCTTGGATTITITPDPGHNYYLVVPTNSIAEGSYGKNSSGVQRPQGGNACRIQAVGACGI